MENRIKLIAKSPLFNNISEEEILKMLKCISQGIIIYKKNEIVMNVGSKVKGIGLVLRGRVQISKIDIKGQEIILTEINKNGIFAETIASIGIKESPVIVRAMEESQIIFIDYEKAIYKCENLCDFHSKFVSNLLKIIAQRNLLLNRKIEVLSKKTIRGKLMTYFIQELEAKGIILENSNSKQEIKIPFSRTDLARFIGCDRSAMVRELGKMKDEGIVELDKNRIFLL